MENQSRAYHIPVLLEESVTGLKIDSGGKYLDLTFGGGGHSRKVLQSLQEGKLYGFDQDRDAAEVAGQLENRSLTFIQANFRYFGKYLRAHKEDLADGILADLGVSSHQFDEAERGFSFRFDADLDMRMNQAQHLTAQRVVNEYEEKDLHRILGMYGEVKNARTLASAICNERPFQSTKELADLLTKVAKKGGSKYAAQVFQAIRIEVNDEMKALEEMLLQTSDWIKPGGRLVIITYHSLEDRLVKNFMSKGKFFGEVEKDEFGNMIRPFEPLTRKPILPNSEEVERNPRARSAKLRIAKRL